jgi:hypothetical protein
VTVVAECTILAAVRTALTVRFPDSPMFVDNSPLTVSLLIVSYQSFTQILLCLLSSSNVVAEPTVLAACLQH